MSEVWGWTLGESWAMYDALTRNLPMQIAMGVLLKNLFGVSPSASVDGGGGVDAGGSRQRKDDDPEEDENVLRRFSR